MQESRLEELLSKFPRLHVGLLGDLFLDRYLELTGDVEHSIETGLEAYQVQRVRNAPGALGTVISNLAALQVGRLSPVTVIGDDGHGYDLRAALRGLPLSDEHLLTDPERLTPTYTKPLRPTAGGSAATPAWTELNRLDVRTRAPLREEMLDRLIRSLRAVWQEADGLVVLDQLSEPECGVVNSAVRDELQRLARQRPDKLMLIDSRSQLGQFRCGTLKGNRSELVSAARPEGEVDAAALSDEQLCGDLQQLRGRTGCDVYCTDGSRGIWVAEAAEVYCVPAVPVRGPIDIVGAGDSATSGIVAALLSGARPREAAALGNLAASVSIGQLGQTGTASPQQLREQLRQE